MSCNTTTSVEDYIDEEKYVEEITINDTLIKYWSDKDYFTIYHNDIVIGSINNTDSLKKDYRYYLDIISNNEAIKYQGKLFFKHKCTTCHRLESDDDGNILKTIHSDLIKEHKYDRNTLDTILINNLLQGDKPVIYKKYYNLGSLNYHVNYWMSGPIGKISLESYLNSDERTLIKDGILPNR